MFPHLRHMYILIVVETNVGSRYTYECMVSIIDVDNGIKEPTCLKSKIVKLVKYWYLVCMSHLKWFYNDEDVVCVRVKMVFSKVCGTLCGHPMLRLIYEWYMTKVIVKNEHQKDMCSNEIGLIVQMKLINLSSAISSI